LNGRGNWRKNIIGYNCQMGTGRCGNIVQHGKYVIIIITIIFVHPKFWRLSDNVGKYVTAGQTTDENIIRGRKDETFAYQTTEKIL